MASAQVIQHGRRSGQVRSAPQRPQPQANPELSANGVGVDLRQVKILSKGDWARIQNQLHRKEIEAAQRKQARAGQDEIKNRSHELVKDWNNTLLGARQKKLDERARRLAKEEEEKVQQDIEEAKYAADRRKEMLEKAKVQQYYQTDRVKGFHSALQLTEVLKEREAQIELKRLKEEALKGQDDAYVEKWQREYEDSLIQDQERARDRIVRAHETAKFQLAQINRHMAEQKAEEDSHDVEGDELRRLAIAHALEKKRLEQIGREEQRIMMKENLRQIDDVKKMKEIAILQEQEEDEECRIFAAAKKKMMRLRAEKEREIHEEKQRSLETIKEKLSSQLMALVNDEEDRLAFAVAEAEEKLANEEEEKARKQKEMREGIEKQRQFDKEKRDREAREAKMEEMEMIRVRKEADELFMQNERLRRAKQFEAERDMKNLHMKQTQARIDASRRAKEDQLGYDKESVKLIQLEEEQFQEYAQKVIRHAEKGGRNIYALRRAAEDGAGGGLGPIFPGKGGIRPSYQTSDKRGTQLAHYRRGTTEEVKDIQTSEGTTDKRMGFIW